MRRATPSTPPTDCVARPVIARFSARPSEPYPEYYHPKTSSRDFVLHLEMWYAQAHPLEDFAETFAVWLRPGSRWRTRYRKWPAIKKLEMVDSLHEVHPWPETSGQQSSHDRFAVARSAAPCVPTTVANASTMGSITPAFTTTTCESCSPVIPPTSEIRRRRPF